MHTLKPSSIDSQYFTVYYADGPLDVTIENGLTKTVALRLVNYLNGGDGKEAPVLKEATYGSYKID